MAVQPHVFWTLTPDLLYLLDGSADAPGIVATNLDGMNRTDVVRFERGLAVDHVSFSVSPAVPYLIVSRLDGVQEDLVKIRF